jgi:hypothetical protein
MGRCLRKQTKRALRKRTNLSDRLADCRSGPILGHALLPAGRHTRNTTTGQRQQPELRLAGQLRALWSDIFRYGYGGVGTILDFWEPYGNEKPNFCGFEGLMERPGPCRFPTEAFSVLVFGFRAGNGFRHLRGNESALRNIELKP